MRVAFFGTYNRGHSANRIYADAVRSGGYTLVEIHEPLWERTRDKDAAFFAPAALPRHALAWLGAAWRLAGVWRRSGGAPVALIGFNGQLDVLLLRVLTLRSRPRIVFAPLVTLTETLVEDRRVYDHGSLAHSALRALDRLTCRAADVVVTDTDEHRRYFVEEIGVEPSRMLVCHLGADLDAFDREGGQVLHSSICSDAKHDSGTVEVLYFGQYLPLHGLDVIVDAVGRLASRLDLLFTFIGTGEERARIEPALRATRARVQLIDWVAYEELAGRIARADIVLGIFGASRKARMVIPNKVYEAALVGRAIVTADTPAVAEVFVSGREILTCAADGRALADAIARLADDADLRARLGSQARELMRSRFGRDALGRCWSVAVAGAEALQRERPRMGVAVLCFNDARRTLECLHSLAGDGYQNAHVLVVDNGSAPMQRAELEEGIRGRLDVELLLLEHNLGYAGGNNVALERLFGAGCEAVLVLNSDTRIAPGTLQELAAALRTSRAAGPIGPTVSRDRPGGAVESVGERYWPSLLWAPRSLLRPRARRQRPHRVGGISGCAILIPRALYERVGGFDETLFAYYEEVDLCLRARQAGFAPTVVPAGEVGHEGRRGFAGGMTPLAAYLKARNLWSVAARRLGPGRRAFFAAGYGALIAASAAGYLLRGRSDIASALVAGVRAAARGEIGPPPDRLFAASGYPAPSSQDSMEPAA
ncbi:MAG TPA: glycosyltransferase [Candidatus Limnocylindrales bacterium]|nr:glycosyltransferase [Candidatus Limnocylindrales bacterium]